MNMNFEAFKQTLHSESPPTGVSVYLQSLWYDAKGDWDKAHNLIQDLPDQNAAWIHAYLHRKEGDNWNADYWYRRAGRQRPAVSLSEEWQQITEAFL
jgi:hypothetical protein